MGLVAIIKAVLASRGMPADSGLGLSPLAVIVPIILGTVVTVVSAWAPARRAGAVEPVEAMRTTESAAASSLKVRTIVGGLLMGSGVIFVIAGVLVDAATGIRAGLVGLGALNLIVGFSLAGPALSLPIVPTLGRVIGAPFGAIGKLASTNSKRNPRRTAATAFALTLGVVLVTAIGMLGATMKSSVAETMEKDISADYLLSGPSQGSFPTPVETGERAAKAEGAGEVITVGTAPVKVEDQASLNYGPEHTMSETVDSNPQNIFMLNMVEGDSDIAEGGFIADATTAGEQGWKVGESYELSGMVPGKTTKVELKGIYEDFQMLPKLAVSQKDVEKLLPGDALTVAMVGVNAAEGVDLEQLRTNLEESVKDLVVVQVASGEEYAGEAASMINQMLTILYALLALAVIIAVLGIVNTLTLGVIERRQEIGMLRAVGTQRRQIRTMITLESVQIAVFGAVVGMILGLGLGWAFIKVLSEEGLGSAVIPWGMLAILLVGSAVVGVLAALWPAHGASKTPPLDAIAD